MPQFSFGWEGSKLAASLAIFLLSGMLVIVGGWLVWRAMLGGEGESSEEALTRIEIRGNAPLTSTPASPSSWRGFPTPSRASPSRLCLLVPGIAFLVVYGFVPTLQTLVAPIGGNNAAFGRVFAVYGGFFIVLSYSWGWLADGTRPDGGDVVGASVAIAGVLVAWFWPRVRSSALAP